MNKTMLYLLIIPFLSGCATQTQPLASDLGVEQPAQAAEAHPIPGGGRLVSLPPKAALLANLNSCVVTSKIVPVTVNASAEVSENLNSVVKVNSLVAGSVDSVKVKGGDIVQKGHLLASIRSQDVEELESELLQNRAQVQADLSQALLDIDAQLESLAAQINLSKSSYDRANTLFEEKIGSRAELEATKTTYEKNQIDIDVQKKKRINTIRIFDEKLALVTEPAKQKLSLVGVSKEQINRLLKTGKIEPIVETHAPCAGLVSQRRINPGEVVQAGQQLFTVGDYSTVWLTAQIHEKDINQVKLGQPIELCCESYPDKKFSGHLNYISDSVDKETRTLLVRAEVENPQRLLKPQMYANMKIIVAERRMLTVSKDALQDAGAEKVVYVCLGNGKYKEMPVRIGATCGEQIEILHGLTEGDTVVSNGSFELRAQALKNQESNQH